MTGDIDLPAKFERNLQRVEQERGGQAKAWPPRGDLLGRVAIQDVIGRLLCLGGGVNDQLAVSTKAV